MFERSIGEQEVKAVVVKGDVIASYPDDRPYPSELLLGFVGGRTLHVVASREPATGRCFVVTAYEPDPAVWNDDFKSRRRP